MKLKLPVIYPLLFLLNSISVGQAIPVPSPEIVPESYVCHRIVDSINVDGKLNEQSWEKAAWTNDFVDIEGSLKPLPRFRTRVKMLWDDEYFYFAAVLSEPDIWGKLLNRDDIIFYDNDFEIFIDPDGNTHDYCEFEMNALNTFWDLLLIKPYRDIEKAAIHDWDIKDIKTAVAVNGTLNKPGDIDTSWTVEIAYPWSAFREITGMDLPPKNYDQWRVNFSRVEWKTETVSGKYIKSINPTTNKSYPEDNWVWSPQGVVNMHYPEMWGHVQFSTEPVGDKQVAFKFDYRENAKKLLRQIYYEQSSYKEKFGRYAESFDELNMDYTPVAGYTGLPEIKCAFKTYEARIIADDNSHSVYIRSDGFTWVTENK